VTSKIVPDDQDFEALRKHLGTNAPPGAGAQAAPPVRDWPAAGRHDEGVGEDPGPERMKPAIERKGKKR
jgi:hypothetical protein